MWADSLFLSIMALDMAGNSLNLYTQEWRFDLIPHAYGPGAGVVALKLLGLAWLPGALLVNATHLMLEAQEALGDLLFGTHNVNGWWDTLTDLSAGALTSLGAPLLWKRCKRGQWAADTFRAASGQVPLRGVTGRHRHV